MNQLRQGVFEYLMDSAPEALKAAASGEVAHVLASLGERGKLLLDGDADLGELANLVSAELNSRTSKSVLEESELHRLLEDWRTAAVKSRPYYLSLPVWPEFAAPNNPVDGLLPTCRVRSWEHFVEVMRDPDQNRARHEIIYRGQRGYNWPLASTLTRQFSDGSIRDEDRDALLMYFRLAMRGRGPDLTVMEDEDVWAYGQHVGLATPLLDWSKSPFVSLYFAFAEPDPETAANHSRAVFCLDMTRLKVALSELFVEPRSNDNARLVSQAGLFTLTPSGSENFESYIINALQENSAVDFDGFEDLPTPKNGFEFPANDIARKLAPYICKIHIPNERRLECLAMLRKMNIHHGSLFPDPFGAAQYCNDWLVRKIKEDDDERKAAESAKIAAEAEAKVARSAERAEAASKEAELKSHSTAGTSLEDRVKQLIAQNAASFKQDLDTSSWARSIIQNYSNLESVDWVRRETTRASVKRGLARQLGLLGAGSLSNDLAAQLVDIFADEYSRRNNLDFEGKKEPSIGYDFFAAGRADMAKEASKEGREET
ncbi:FRG domain-containing protein [Rhizobium sp. RU36D]|uniref:FRG domain-containing protein n=1 Tax=Rhizobium sp. RU36D TaxID=1907415 RepID=UPI0009D7BDF9|nr:FRG domain-containing protein [Rhizobium sp. RU36D]SMD19704.1 FRG domain-containing protein [Rhizobium sp. RU36D]